jgi:LysM repeat protein
MKNKLLTGLAAILLAGGLPHDISAQKREYMQGNVHDVKYELTTQKDFPKYKLEEQCLFNNCYTFWEYTPKSNELNFSVSNNDEQTNVFEVEGNVSIESQKYIPIKIGDNINVTNLNITRTSYEKLKKRAKEKQGFGFSVDITDRDLKFKLPEININGTKYIVLKEMLDNSNKQKDLSFYLIPKTKGTKISFPNQPFTEENGYEIQAQIFCSKDGGVYQPIAENKITLNSEGGNYPAGIREQDTSKTNTQLKKEETQEYTIKAGDTFYNLADRFYGTGKDAYWIQKSNPNVDPSKLKIGQKIIIPKR